MKNIIVPNKVKKGAHIRVIAPVRSLKFISDQSKEEAIARLEKFGFTLSFGKHVDEIDTFNSSSIESRIEDLHEAFADKQVDAILTVIGGHNSNQLLQHIDYDLIAQNPKIICGFSDVTALANAITAMTGMITYIGPHFSSWAMQQGFEYSLESFKKCCMEQGAYDIAPSNEWSDDPWFIDQENRTFIPNDGYWVMNHGYALGRIVGGNISTFNLLQGTKFWHGLEHSILVMENDSGYKIEMFERLLQSLVQQTDFDQVRGILIGRFQKENNVTKKLLQEVLSTKEELRNVPIIANVDFGHTTPLATLPIGGSMEMVAGEDVRLKIIEH